MADEPVKPTAQIYKLTTAGSLRKDLGPTGGNNPGNAVQPNAFEPEDEYQQLYVGATRDQGIIQPPHSLRQLDRLALENNALGPCIEAMVTNVDGTGYDFESEDGDAEDTGDDLMIKSLTEFFDEPWPGVSFTTMREVCRRDLERVGNAYFEILRNAQDDIVFFRHVDAKMMRMLRLDDAVPIDQTVIRNGKRVTIKVMTRERRYCQLVNGVSLMYFKEFGSTRDLHKKTAVWAPQSQRLPANMRATEIMHFTVLPDSHTPYGIPRWINQLPSVLGSRKAEEFNLDFFDNGGIPPVLILLQGGTLQAETRKALQSMTTGEATRNNRVQVLEVETSTGTIDSTAQARVTVERFGSERQKDSMFEGYDAKCEERVRRSFRLPPIFIGQSKDYNFATAFASYVVAEAQVFKPERDKFDEQITMRLITAMGYDGYKMRSKPLVIEDATLKLQGIEIAMGIQQVEPADVIEAVNEVVGTHLKVSADAPMLKDTLQPAMPPGATHTIDANGQVKPINPSPKDPALGGARPPSAPGAKGQNPGKLPKPVTPALLGSSAQGMQPGGGTTPIAKSDRPKTALDLAMRAMTAMRKRDFTDLAFNLSIIRSLDAEGQEAFNDAATQLAFVDTSFDPEGLADLACCTMAVMSGQFHKHVN
jgi:PBSX family phage portal protein